MKRTDIQALRGFAVLAVLLFHLQILRFKGGFLGVDIFFVISGFVITQRLAKGEGSFSAELIDFYKRRVKRILPASLFTIALTALLSRIFLAPISLATFAHDGVAATLFAGNFRFAGQGNDYLNQSMSPTPYLHYWSLGVEEQFYLVWPILFLLFLRARKSRQLLVIPLFAIATTFAIWYTHIAAVNSFYLPISRAWEFLAGIVIALLLPHIPRGGRFIAIAGWVMITYSILFLGSDLAVPGVTTLIPVAGAMAILVGAAKNPWEPLLAWFGDNSFAIYLIHWPLVVIALSRYQGLTASSKAVIAVLAIAGGYLITRFIERPFRFQPRFAWGLGRWAVVVVALAGLLMGVSSVEAASVKSAKLRIDRSEPIIYSDGCHLGFGLAKPSSPCLFGDLQSTTEVVLTGDSHAAQWFPAMEAIAIAHHWKLLVLTKSSCPALFLATTRNGIVDSSCVIWQKYVSSRIAAEKPSRVFVTSYSEYSYALAKKADYAQSYSSGEVSFIQSLGLANASIYYLEDSPHPPQSPAECLSKHVKDPSRCNFPLIRSAATLATRYHLQALGIHYINLSSLLCPGDTCTALYEGANTYRDGSHISVSASKALTAQLETFIH